jgi:hypothetical protein
MRAHVRRRNEIAAAVVLPGAQKISANPVISPGEVLKFPAAIKFAVFGSGNLQFT